MPSLRSSPWILGAPHNGLATLIWWISWRISTVTAGRPQRCFDFHRQYDLNPARCQRITVSGRTIASAPYILGNSRQTPPNINLSIETNRSLLGLARRSTLICCLSTRISASSATCDRTRSLAIPKISRQKSNIGYQHRAILSRPPARLNLRQGQVVNSLARRGCGPVGLVHTQNLRFFYKEKPTCGFGECPLWMEERTLSISGSSSAFDPYRKSPASFKIEHSAR
jgi:hypothetical protein